MNIKVDELELLTILQGLEALHDKAKEYREITYDNQQDFIIDFNNIRMLHNKILIEAQNNGYLEKNIKLI